MVGPEDRSRDDTLAELRPVRPDPLTDRVQRELLTYLTAGYRRSNEKLPPERTLASRLNVSRSVIREALRVLEDRGLIVTVPGSGRFVRAVAREARDTPTNTADFVVRHERQALIEIFEVRLALEPALAALAAQRATAADFEHVAVILDQLARAGRTDDEDFPFHLAVARASHNLNAARILTQQIQRMGEFSTKVYLRLSGADALGRWLDEDRRLLEVMRRGADREAAALMREHIEHSLRLIAAGDD